MRKTHLGFALILVCLTVILAGCGGGNEQSTPPPGPPPPPPPSNNISVTVSPSTANLTIGQTTTFTAQVQNTSNTAVTWAVNGVAGGNPTVGTISASGLYTAPGRVPSGAVTISATSAADTSKSANASVNVNAFTGMLMWHGDLAITGQNSKENTLTTANVNQNTFGKLASYPVDDQVFAQPLYVANVPFPGAGQHNAIYVATSSNTVYAFDADGMAQAPFWKKTLTPGGEKPVDGTKTGGIGGPITPNVGITGTPVIDGSSGTLYVVTVSTNTSTQVQRHLLHALDITTGNEKFGGPVQIKASVAGSGAGSSGGQMAFDSTLELQRTALTLVKGVVYVAFSSYQDFGNYHGWLLGYDASTLKQVRVWNATPDGHAGGIWMSGAGLSVDSAGNLYLVTGNGTFDANNGGRNYGDSIVKLTPNGTGFTVSDYFTPFDQANLALNDIDLGSSGVTLILNQAGPSLGVNAGKAGKIYLVDINNMGHFQSGSDSQIVQSIPNAVGTGPDDLDYSTAAYWNGNVYYIGDVDVVKQFKLSSGQLSTSPVAKGSHTYGYPGANMSVSSNGTSNGILWTIEASGVNVLHAYDATNVANELYNSNQAGGRDKFGVAIRFTVPTVMNGKVYVAGQSQLAIFGLM